MKKIGKKWSVVNGNTAMQINEKEVDTMELMSAAQTADVAPEEVQPVATPEQVAQPEKVGILTRFGNGIKSTGQKLWNNRGKIAFVGGVLSTIAGAVVYDRIRNGKTLSNNELDSDGEWVEAIDNPDGSVTYRPIKEETETSETTENTEVE